MLFRSGAARQLAPQVQENRGHQIVFQDKQPPNLCAWDAVEQVVPDVRPKVAWRPDQRQQPRQVTDEYRQSNLSVPIDRGKSFSASGAADTGKDHSRQQTDGKDPHKLGYDGAGQKQSF